MARSMTLSPDGSRVAVVGMINGKQALSYSQPDLLLISLQPGSTPRNLTEKYDADPEGALEEMRETLIRQSNS